MQLPYVLMIMNRTKFSTDSSIRALELPPADCALANAHLIIPTCRLDLKSGFDFQTSVMSPMNLSRPGVESSPMALNVPAGSLLHNPDM